jgi:hypothetical protein
MRFHRCYDEFAWDLLDRVDIFPSFCFSASIFVVVGAAAPMEVGLRVWVVFTAAAAAAAVQNFFSAAMS